jgi:HK97 family phage prohead protease
MTIETRTLVGDLEVRADGRTLVGTLVPYDTLTRIGSYHESFRRGVFADVVPERVPLLATHAHDELPIGRAVELTDTDTGLQAALRVSETRAGDDVLALVRDGAATGLSVGFVPIDDVWDARRTKVERARATLVEVSVVAFPAYADARITAVRTAPGAAGIGHPAAVPRLTVARYRL